AFFGLQSVRGEAVGQGVADYLPQTSRFAMLDGWKGRPTFTAMPEPTRAKRRCATCGASVRAKDRFCPSCGTPLDQATTAATAPAPAGSGSASLQVAGHTATALGEQRKVVTVVFADLSGSTPLGERLDPEELRTILASYFTALARQIARYEGTIDKYIG